MSRVKRGGWEPIPSFTLEGENCPNLALFMLSDSKVSTFPSRRKQPRPPDRTVATSGCEPPPLGPLSSFPFSRSWGKRGDVYPTGSLRSGTTPRGHPFFDRGSRGFGVGADQSCPFSSDTLRRLEVRRTPGTSKESVRI